MRALIREVRCERCDRTSVAAWGTECSRVLDDPISPGIDPRLGETVHDPACGTGGFLLSASVADELAAPK